MLNQYLFEAINNLAGRNVWLDRLGIFFADYTLYLVLIVLVVVCLVQPTIKNRVMAVLALLAGAVGKVFVVDGIRSFFHYPRPFLAMHVHQLVAENEIYSFPSGHSVFLFAVATLVYMYHKKLGGYLYVIAILTAVARVFVGVHWPADILAGAGFGILTALAVYEISHKRLAHWLT